MRAFPRPRGAGLSRTIVATALAAIPATAPASPIIQEVLYDPSGSDAGAVFTEIFGTPGLALDGWTLVGINGSNGAVYRTVALDGAVLPSDGLLVVATATAEPALAAVRDFVGSVDWQNGPDAVQLADPTGLVVDALQYGDAGPNNAGFGTPAADPSDGASLSRDLFGLDTGDNAADFLAGVATPGIGPSIVTPGPPPGPMPGPGPGPGPGPEPETIPEPSTVVLLGLALGAALRRHRRAM